jgi:hypothetical protein
MPLVMATRSGLAQQCKKTHEAYFKSHLRLKAFLQNLQEYWMVEDTAKVGKLFAHRIETDDLFDESKMDFLSSYAAEETFVPSAAIRWLVVVHL